MKQTFRLLCWLSLVLFPAPAGAATDLADAIVTVVSLSEQGHPRRQGMGVVVAKDGLVLTSASLLAGGRAGVIKTNSGSMQLIQQLRQIDLLQDLALLQIEAEGLTPVPLGVAKGLRPLEKVWVGVRKGNRCVLEEAAVAKTYPLSPRVVLVKLAPAGLEKDPGAPIFNTRGELAGMLHSFAASGASEAINVCLLRQQACLPEKSGSGDNQAPAISWESLAPNSTSSFWEGVAASQRQAWQPAREKFTAALESAGWNPEAYFCRGVAAYHLGDDAGAARDFAEAARRLPGYALAFLWLGKVRERQGNQASAQEAYQQAVILAPDLDEAWFLLGTMAYRQGRLDRAQECLNKIQSDFPQTAQRWWYLANIAQARHRWPEAMEAFTQAMQSEPGFFLAYLEGGKLLLENLGQPKEAIGLLQKAVRLEPRHPSARYYLALAHLLAWNPGGAWEQYFALREISPELATRLAEALEGTD
jgi:tetratricopeptide (TPR) repeat protein